ncbi:type IX secretion system ring subunit PorN/GldN [Solitalea koreensis]|uniref:Gliding motility associated protien GldN n=1 Tax=Solitalea koreensis TaxID=543615 RepID=A0A521AUA1_9SPHI|nr:gliding motility protein GldN [Solitalea koreensis]SMO38374.1 gliding motility associated protien GldN [Solitalea koreensis]
MKFKLTAIAVILSCLTVVASAQTKKKTTAGKAKTTASSSAKKVSAVKTNENTSLPVAAVDTVVKNVSNPTGSASLFDTPLVDGVYKKENNVNIKVIPYSYIRQSDVMWSKRIWRELDVKEKANKPLTYPQSRLIDVLIKGIRAGELTVYDANTTDDSTFRRVLSMAEFEQKVSGGSTTAKIPVDINRPELGERDTTISEPFKPEEVRKYRIKEDWIFDKQRSIFEPRIIAIAPIKEYFKGGDDLASGGTLVSEVLFWIYFPEARQVLANAEVFNRFNDASNLSFDDFFIKRLFSSYIIKESNADDVRIANYASGIDRLYESERIKNKIMDFEQDLWEY